MSDVTPGRVHRGSSDECCSSLLEVYAYLDGHLSVERHVVVEAHVADCDDCCGSVAFHAELRRVVSCRCQEEVPDSLRLRVVEAIRMQSRGR